MGYSHDVVRGAWSGMSTIAARYTIGDWPLDGSLQNWVDGASSQRPLLPQTVRDPEGVALDIVY